jgi:hypothetical protein
VKCFILDEEIVLTGSMNLTHNGMENNKEHLYRLSEPAFVADVLAEFEKEWLVADIVTDKEIAVMLETDRKRQDKKRDQSISRSISTRPGEGTSSFEGARGSYHGIPWRECDGRPVALPTREASSASRPVGPLESMYNNLYQPGGASSSSRMQVPSAVPLRMQNRHRGPQDLEDAHSLALSTATEERLAADERFAKEIIGRRHLKGDHGQTLGYINDDRQPFLQTNGVAGRSSRHP